MTAQEARDRLQARVADLTGDMLLAAILAIGGGSVAIDKTVVRAFMLSEFERRYGGEAVDALMDNIGM